MSISCSQGPGSSVNLSFPLWVLDRVPSAPSYSVSLVGSSSCSFHQAPSVTLSHQWVLDQVLNDSTALSKGLPWWLRDESICLKCRRPGLDPWVGKIPWKREWQPTPVLLGFPGGSGSKESTCNAGDLSLIMLLPHLLLGTYVFTTAESFWCNGPFIKQE